LAQTNPWIFLSEFVYTLDQADGKIKKFPDLSIEFNGQSRFEYLKVLVEEWQKHRLLIIPKGRRMMITWTFLGLALWDTMFNTGRLTFIQKLTEKDSEDLLNYVKFIYNHLPEWIRKRHPVKDSKSNDIGKRLELEFEGTYSVIRAVPQGAKHFRGYYVTGAILDEFRECEEQEEMMASVIPALGETGWVVIISTAGGHDHFEKMVKDK